MANPCETDAVIVSAVRTAVGRAHRGSLATMRPDDMAAAVIAAAVERAPSLDPAAIEDVIMGCAMPEAEQGMNIGRIAALRAGLPHTVSAQTINRFCSSGLQSIALAAQQIMSGMGEVVVAGGVESMSMISMAGNVFAPNPTLAELHPEVYMPMGLTAEQVAQRYAVSREDQDEFALLSHQNAQAAIDAGKFTDEIVPLQVTVTRAADGGGFSRKTFRFDTDEGVRRDTSLQALARLKPAFSAAGTVTAGNASQTSDGAAALVVMSRAKANALGLQALARFVSFAVGGVPPEIMGIGPTVAIPKALKLAGLSLEQLDVFELNEAFAAQALAVIRTLGMDLSKVNVNGGAIALGHPLGCTGAKLTVQLLHEMRRRGSRYGMGAAGIFENLAD